MNNSRFSLARFINSPIRVVLIIILVLLVGGVFYASSASSVASLPSLYQYQQSYLGYSSQGNQYKIVIVADMDEKSLSPDDSAKWRSYLKHAELLRAEDGTYSITWKEQKELTSKYNEGKRGMELSELVYFNNRLLTCDDRSGIVFEIDMNQYEVQPLYIFSGNENKQKGFKCEWMTVKDDLLYIGSMGKAWTSPAGVQVNDDPLWVKTLSPEGITRSVNWKQNFHKLDAAVGIKKEGYLVHEAVNWDPVSNQWIFLPRRVSVGQGYNADTEGEKGSNTVLVASEDFSSVEKYTVGEHLSTHGFSSFKFIPHRHNEIVALKTIEHKDTVESYIMVFDLATKKVLLEETLIDTNKFEGVEFI
eukprot:TRINITY_DN11770_c0_g1_i1.p1 TRINITY_DN11770_c0_g1~~TRINITY_DN11770_c0_g1_i1.p1  ORF type:complete len:361 (-),score=63.82 TRINITY_DN11770_c0_g1_i1:56-1138(-)